MMVSLGLFYVSFLLFGAALAAAAIAGDLIVSIIALGEAGCCIWLLRTLWSELRDA